MMEIDAEATNGAMGARALGRPIHTRWYFQVLEVPPFPSGLLDGFFLRRAMGGLLCLGVSLVVDLTVAFSGSAKNGSGRPGRERQSVQHDPRELQGKAPGCRCTKRARKRETSRQLAFFLQHSAALALQDGNLATNATGVSRHATEFLDDRAT
jgi:hypothetical protein